MKSNVTKPATTTAKKTATTIALAPATRPVRVSAKAEGRTLIVSDNVSGAEIKLVVNENGGLERELTNCEKHDKQYGNNIAVAIEYTVAHLANRKLGVAKNLQKLAKTMNAIPATNIRNMSNRLRATINAEYDLQEGNPDRFFHEQTKLPKKVEVTGKKETVKA